MYTIPGFSQEVIKGFLKLDQVHPSEQLIIQKMRLSYPDTVLYLQIRSSMREHNISFNAHEEKIPFSRIFFFKNVSEKMAGNFGENGSGRLWKFLIQ